MEVEELDFEERRDIVYKILAIGKKNLFNSSQKQAIYQIIINLEKSTDLQIERLVLYYNFKDGEKEYRLCDLGRKYNCTGNAIKFSIDRTKNRLIHIKDEDMLVLKNILEECVKEHNIIFG